MINTEQVKNLFDYVDGDLYWKTSARQGWKGKKAGSLTNEGYITIKIDGKAYKAHRLIMLWHGFELNEHVDHIDGNRANNKIENLRSCLESDNAKNRPTYKNSTTKIKNVVWNKKNKNYNVVIQANNKRKHIGCFYDLELAELVAYEAREKYHGVYARHGN